MMYSFSEEPGIARALKRLLSNCSMNGAISAGEMLQNPINLEKKTMIPNTKRQLVSLK